MWDASDETNVYTKMDALLGKFEETKKKTLVNYGESLDLCVNKKPLKERIKEEKEFIA
jgi:plasmid rolling circle replication initiator protein Rep